MKRKFSIIAEWNGKRAAILIETDAEWTPLIYGDDVSGFIPELILTVDAADDNGSRAITVQTVNCDGMDIKCRPRWAA